MAKSMEDRKKYVGAIYAGVVDSHPELKKEYKPDLSGWCDKYDNNKDAYDKLVKRKAELTKYIDQAGSVIGNYNSEIDSLKDEQDKVWKQNAEMTKKYQTQLAAFQKDGDKADTSKVVDAFKGFADSTKEMMELDNAHLSRKQKLHSQAVTDIKKCSDGYEKESKDIKTAIDKLEADTDHLEAQIRSGVLTLQKMAVKKKNDSLETDLEKVLAGFP